MKRLVGSIGFALIALAAPVTTFAQSATPAAGQVVPAQLCQVEPRTVESLQAIIEEQPSDGTDVRIPVRFAPGEGTPADPATALAVTVVMTELAACYNAGDLLRIYGLFTDAALIPALLPEDVAEASQAAQGTPQPITHDGYETPEVTDVRVQLDGRVTAMVDFNDEIALITFAWNGERYLIDLFDDQIVQGIATPTS
jgi:hypothetical protein